MYDCVSYPLCVKPTQPSEHVGVKRGPPTPSPLGVDAHKCIEFVGDDTFTLFPFSASNGGHNFVSTFVESAFVDFNRLRSGMC